MAYLSLLDMFDGGGAGASGSEFKGGPVSGLLNQLGVRPSGYKQRTAGMDQMPQMRPRQSASARSPVSASPISPPMSVDPRINATWNRQQPMTEPTMPPPAYSGRGVVGMPIDPSIMAALDPDALAALQYLRSIGWSD